MITPFLTIPYTYTIIIFLAILFQTIPFSEDPVWKEIEGLTTFEPPEVSPSRQVNFDEIDELLRIATGGQGQASDRSRAMSLPRFDAKGHIQTLGDEGKGQHLSQHQGHGQNWVTADKLTSTGERSVAQSVMTTSYTPTLSHVPTVLDKPRKLSDSNYPPKASSKYSYTPPTIQPLKLNSSSSQKKSSTSALDEVLEDIRATLQKKPLSPKLMKNIDTPDSSSANPSLQSPLTKSTKAFVFTKNPQKPEPPAPPPRQKTPSASATPGYDNAQPSWQASTQIESGASLVPNPADLPYIDPEFTQFPYIINGNYHLDPDLLSEKLKGTGLVNESSDEQSVANRRKAYNDALANQSSHLMTTSFNQNAVNSSNYSSNPSVQELDKSVTELKTLAKEVEHKLSQIKTRIVSADENSLDSILLALRKFAPLTEQQYFGIKSKPDFEAEKLRRRKLEDALSELERMYESLDLDDKSLMDRASRREETASFQAKYANNAEAIANKPSTSGVSSHSQSGYQGDKQVLRKSQIEEIERQTQNEFEDITKSFQVLLDEVTKQCKTVGRGDYQTDNLGHGHSGSSAQDRYGATQFSGQRPRDEICQEPPRQQFKHETSRSQRAVQDSYNKAIRDLENVAQGQFGQSFNQPQSKKPNKQSSALYLNLEKANNQNYNQNLKNVGTVSSPSRSLDIQLQSRAMTTVHTTSPRVKSPSAQKPFVSMATEFKPSISSVSMATEFKPSVSSDSRQSSNSSTDNAEDKSQSTVTMKVDLASGKVKGEGRGGRFRRRGHIEHRKSMPAITRTVETQTVETQTEPSASASDVKEMFEQRRKSSLHDSDTGSFADVQSGRVFLRKLSGTKVSDLVDSSEEEFGRKKRDSKLRHSLSAPDIVGLLDYMHEDSAKRRQTTKVDPIITRQLQEQLGLQAKDKERTEQTTEKTVLTQETEGCVETPKRKPPVYPVWKYPGQSEVPTSPSKKLETKRSPFAMDKAASDTETDRTDRAGGQSNTELGAVGGEPVEGSGHQTLRRRTRSVGGEQEQDQERPRSFHELVALFEQRPERLEKLRSSGLRKCASEDSMFTDLVLQKIYHSESDVNKEEDDSKRSSSFSSVKMALQKKLKHLGF